MNWREDLRFYLLREAMHLVRLRAEQGEETERDWERLELIIKAYGSNLRAEQSGNLHWVCVADVKSRCTRSNRIESDSHKSCGEYELGHRWSPDTPFFVR